jgi:hypothetical protein
MSCDAKDKGWRLCGIWKAAFVTGCASNAWQQCILSFLQFIRETEQSSDFIKFLDFNLQSSVAPWYLGKA